MSRRVSRSPSRSLTPQMRRRPVVSTGLISPGWQMAHLPFHDEACVIKHRCTTGKERRIRRWEHEDILERVQKRLDDDPDKIPLRSKTVEHPFGTIKAWMGATHFRMKTLKHVATEMALHVLAYNMTRVIAILGVSGLIKAMRA